MIIKAQDKKNSSGWIVNNEFCKPGITEKNWLDTKFKYNNNGLLEKNKTKIKVKLVSTLVSHRHK